MYVPTPGCVQTKRQGWGGVWGRLGPTGSFLFSYVLSNFGDTGGQAQTRALKK